MYKFVFVFVIYTVFGFAVSSPAEQCAGKYTEGLQDRIHVSPCDKSHCNLIKGTNTTVTFKFMPKYDVDTLTNVVYANIGIDLPFIGVTGADACPNIFHADTMTPAPCPLEAGKEYTYVNTFYMEPLYPTLSFLRVHWDLLDGNKSVICFEIPASIGHKKKKASHGNY